MRRTHFMPDIREVQEEYSTLAFSQLQGTFKCILRQSKILKHSLKPSTPAPHLMLFLGPRKNCIMWNKEFALSETAPFQTNSLSQCDILFALVEFVLNKQFTNSNDAVFPRHISFPGIGKFWVWLKFPENSCREIREKYYKLQVECPKIR